MKKKPTNPFRFSFNSFPIGFPNEDPIREAALKSNLIDKYTFRYEAFYFGGEDLSIYPVAKALHDHHLIIIPYPGIETNKLLPSNEARKYIPAIDGNREVQFDEKELPKKIKGISDPWGLFSNCCTFDCILHSLSPESMQYAEITGQDIEAATGNAYYRLSDEQTHGFRPMPDYKKLLLMIRDHPALLYSKRVLQTFSGLLADAIHSNNDKQRKVAKSLFDKYLFQRSRGKKPILIDKQLAKLAIEILKKLSEHLSKEICKDRDARNKIKERMGWYIEKIRQRNNVDVRIKMLSDELIELLILSPKDRFIPTLVKAKLGRTLETLSK